MKNITTRQYQILADHMRIYQFMIDIYEKDWRNGVPAPFLEYALSSEWMDKSYTHRNRCLLYTSCLQFIALLKPPVQTGNGNGAQQGGGYIFFHAQRLHLVPVSYTHL